jgi:hypothetical protein
MDMENWGGRRGAFLKGGVSKYCNCTYCLWSQHSRWPQIEGQLFQSAPLLTSLILDSCLHTGVLDYSVI